MRRTIIAAGIAATALIATPAVAQQTHPDGLTMTHHRVVTASTLPHCHYEDGSGGPRPCTWNVGHIDGNGRGLAYWVGTHRNGTDTGWGTHYVWGESPVLLNRRHNRWVPRSWARDFSQHADGPHHGVPFWRACWYRGSGAVTIHCANGTTYNAS